MKIELLYFGEADGMESREVPIWRREEEGEGGKGIYEIIQKNCS